METFRIQKEKTLYEKLSILSDAAKYDVACTSSGIKRSEMGQGSATASRPGSATVSLLTAGAFPC